MRYFTPELYMQLQDLRDEAANEEWDRRVERYDAELDRLMQQFPEAVKEFATRINLHDAEIRSMGLAGLTLTMNVALEPPSTQLVTLKYALTEPPRILRDTYDAAFCSPRAEWMYDEIGLDEGSGALTHDILLGNGWEVRLKFRDLAITWSEALLPVPAIQPQSV